MEDVQRRFYSSYEAATVLGLNRSVLYEYLRDGHIPGQRIGNRWFIPKDEIDAMRARNDEISIQSLDDTIAYGCVRDFLSISFEGPSLDRRAYILLHRIGPQPKTLAWIGGELGLTRERIREIEADTLRKLRRRFFLGRFAVSDIPHQLERFCRVLLVEAMQRLEKKP